VIPIPQEVQKEFAHREANAHNMFVVARKSDKVFKEVSYTSNMAISSEDSHGVCLKIIEEKDCNKKEIAEYNRIYYVFEGELQLAINNKENLLYSGDACFVEKGMLFEIKGTFKALSVHKRAQLS
jgi:mannose-6-phosphate isomerase-like protein (cupin superfamily)